MQNESKIVNPASPNILEIKGFSARIGMKEILHDISLSVVENQITAVIGPSGSGKSVLLKSIVGTFKEELNPGVKLVYDGEILFRGKDLLTVREKEFEQVRRRIAYLNQYPIAFPGNIFENVTLALRYWKPTLSTDDLEEEVEKALHQVRLWDEVKHRLRDSPRELSAGQLQRLCIARALALEPDLLLLDEPCAYIDPISTLSLEDLFRDLRKNRTVFIVTHNMQQAARISDMTLFMTSRWSEKGFSLVGEIVEFGKSDIIFTRPNDRRTEDYITGRFG